MSDLNPLKTWSHLASRRRKPSEYEIVSTNLLWSMDRPEQPWELGPGGFMSDWYRKHRTASPLKHESWDGFRDPDEMTYRTYNMTQDGQESYVDGLLDEHDRIGHDKGLAKEWVATLAKLYTPGRYLMHSVQMASAYLVAIVPASTIANCAIFQAADALRWLSRTAYRTRELANSHAGAGFARDERQHWENLPAWQGFRELMERTLVTYDWAEAFAALNLVAKPAIDEAFLRQFAAAARRHNDQLFALLADAQLRDSDRARRWTTALVQYAVAQDGNKKVLADWAAKWAPLGDKAIEQFCAALPDGAGAADEAKNQARAYRAGLGLA